MLARELELNYIPSEEQIADILTKPLTFTHFNYFISKLNVQPCPLNLKGLLRKLTVYKRKHIWHVCINDVSVVS